ncbi:hypothetical protein H6P81_009442 [Aristolochia fimbriata]|uniref:Uncharacterized protein n=1 Tax=Aristolochia fimbriata TaxID=158543 RepID=A0AAV7EP11_ARIFI|nr:hypothetical protein H6P81_009442 [Aristolochia fimbriata]
MMINHSFHFLQCVPVGTSFNRNSSGSLKQHVHRILQRLLASEGLDQYYTPGPANFHPCTSPTTAETPEINHGLATGISDGIYSQIVLASKHNSELRKTTTAAVASWKPGNKGREEEEEEAGRLIKTASGRSGKGDKPPAHTTSRGLVVLATAFRRRERAQPKPRPLLRSLISATTSPRPASLPCTRTKRSGTPLPLAGLPRAQRRLPQLSMTKGRRPSTKIRMERQRKEGIEERKRKA